MDFDFLGYFVKLQEDKRECKALYDQVLQEVKQDNNISFDYKKSHNFNVYFQGSKRRYNFSLAILKQCLHLMKQLIL